MAKKKIILNSRDYPDRSAEPCDECGEPSGRVCYPRPPAKLLCGECVARRWDAERAKRRDERLSKAEKV